MRRPTPNSYGCKLLWLLRLLPLLLLWAAPAQSQETTTAKATLVDVLFKDLDGDHVPSCGEEINYIFVLDSAVLGVSLEDVLFEATVPAGADVVPGTVVPANPNDTPVVLSGNAAGDRAIRVRLGTVCRDFPCTQFGASMTFRLRIRDPNPGTSIAIQGRLTGTNFPPALTDDLELPGFADPTVTTFAACPGGPAPGPGEPSVSALKIAELETDRDGDGQVDEGDTVRYTVQVRNTFPGTGTADQVRFATGLDPASSLVVGSVTVTRGAVLRGNAPGDNRVEVNVGDLPVGAESFVTFDAVVHDPVPASVTRLVCQGQATGGNFPPVPTDDPRTPAPADPTVTPLDFDPDLSLAKGDGGATVSPGNVVAYTLTYKSLSSHVGASGAFLAEQVPAATSFAAAASSPGWSCAGGAGPGTPCTLDLGTVGPGAAGSRVFAVRLDPRLRAGTTAVRNTAMVGDDGTQGKDKNPADNSASDTTPIVGAVPKLALAKTLGPGSEPRPGGLLLFRLAYRNDGSLEAVGVTLHETVPAATTFVPGSSSPGWVCAPNGKPGASCSLLVGSVLAGSGGEAVFAVRVDDPVEAGVDAIENCAQVADGAKPPATRAVVESCLSPPLPEARPDLRVGKDDGGVSAKPGDIVRYRLSYTNAGNQGATGVVLSETVPAHTSFVGGLSTKGWSCTPNGGAGGACTLAVGDLPAGAAGAAVFAVRAADPFPGEVDQVENTVRIADDGRNGPDRDPADNAASDTTPVTHPATPPPPPPPLPPPPPPPAPTPTAALEAFLDDELAQDADHDGKASAGDGLTYQAVVRNDGKATAHGVLLAVPPDPNTNLLTGSVSTDRGTVELGNGEGDQAVRVLLGDLAPGEEGTVLFTVQVHSQLPAHLRELVVQGLATAGDAAQEPTDDPRTVADDDPTRTPLGDGGPGGPGAPADIPTLSEWGLGLFALFLGFGALWYVRGRREGLVP